LGPGTLRTASPGATVTSDGIPVTNIPASGFALAGGTGGVSNVNASSVSAATPGRSW
jgi:hypothetical protein